MSRILAPALAPLGGVALLLAGCGPSDTDPGPGGVSVGEARALDEAAEMIEARRLPPGAIRAQAQPDETPSDRAATQQETTP